MLADISESTKLPFTPRNDNYLFWHAANQAKSFPRTSSASRASKSGSCGFHLPGQENAVDARLRSVFFLVRPKSASSKIDKCWMGKPGKINQSWPNGNSANRSQRTCSRSWVRGSLHNTRLSVILLNILIPKCNFTNRTQTISENNVVVAWI